MSECAIDEMLESRFWFVGITGTVLAIFGVISNALLAVLFLSRRSYRNSPFFFLGFVAFYDTLLDFTYIVLLPVPTMAEYYDNLPVYNFWLHYVKPAYLFGQISKISSVLCLIVASFERYFITRHWTFTGFEQRTRWLFLLFVVLFAISLKLVTFTDIVILKLPMCDRFRRYKVGNLSDNVLMSGLFNIISIFLPFITLVFLNSGIVMMLRKQHIQQLRSLITELTVGPDIMKLRRNNIRSATITLIVIITAYLISNLLNMMITLFEFLWPDFLHTEHRLLYRIVTDIASVLTVVGNAIRCPAHLISNKNIRHHFSMMLFGENNKVGFAHISSMLAEKGF
uniref:G_PROTEIN_RECEP_F1_2 domain-containing protein n=1 Tax=Ascaris lumbricoides TaxID=6252 RepID=A0A0M3I627_ASCLU